MAVVKYNKNDVQLLARLMRAEAEGDGKKGMLLVGNVGINRVRAKCLDFKNINTISKMVYQRPGGFEATIKSYFYQAAREIDKKLALQVINGQRYIPAKTALWFYNPGKQGCKAKWFNQWNSGRYKSHCFYQPVSSQKCF